MKNNLITVSIIWKKGKNGGSWLLVKSDRGSDWEFPKGEVRRGESSVGAILRIMRDNIGMIGEVLEEAGRSSSTIRKNGNAVQAKLIFYLTNYNSKIDDIKPSYQELKWVPMARAMKTLNLEREKRMLKQANQLFKEWKRKKD